MLPGLNSAAVGLIVGAVFSLTFQIYRNSPFPTTSICIGEQPTLKVARVQQTATLLVIMTTAFASLLVLSAKSYMILEMYVRQAPCLSLLV